MNNAAQTWIVSGQHRDSGKLTAVARTDVKAANVAAKQLMASGYIALKIAMVS